MPCEMARVTNSVMGQPKHDRYANFRDAKLIKVLKVEVNEGEGVSGDPIRRVRYFLEPETGKVLFKLGEDTDRQFAGENPMFDY